MSKFSGKFFYYAEFLLGKKTVSRILWHPNPTRLGLQG